MKRRDLIVSTGAVVLAAGIIRGSGAFSNTDRERQVSADVVSDSSAYLRLDIPDSAESSDEIAITNRATTDFDDTFEVGLDFKSVSDVDVTVVSSNSGKFSTGKNNVELNSDEESFTQGERVDIKIEFSGSGKLQVNITAISSGDLAVNIGDSEPRIIKLNSSN